MEPAGALAPELDPEREQTYALFREGRTATSNAALVLLVTAGVFALAALPGGKPVDVSVVIGVLFHHEVGHWAAMRLSGYRNTSIFFIPFFGAGTSGRSVDGSPWKEGLVLLAGPVPGLLLAIPVLGLGIVWRDDVVKRAGWTLIGVNAFNLLPLVPLDGGRLFELVLFRRHPALEVGFRACAVAGLGALAFWLQSVGLGLAAFFMLMTFSLLARIRRAVDGLRGSVDPVGAPGTLAPEELDRLYDAARNVQRSAQVKPQQRADLMLQLLDRLRMRTPGWAASVGLLGAWVGALLVAVAGVVFAAVMTRLAG
jgi:Zn-dependent protease